MRMMKMKAMIKAILMMNMKVVMKMMYPEVSKNIELSI
jgi:hypothetical protein